MDALNDAHLTDPPDNGCGCDEDPCVCGEESDPYDRDTTDEWRERHG